MDHGLEIGDTWTRRAPGPYDPMFYVLLGIRGVGEGERMDGGGMESGIPKYVFFTLNSTEQKVGRCMEKMAVWCP